MASEVNGSDMLVSDEDDETVVANDTVTSVPPHKEPNDNDESDTDNNDDNNVDDRKWEEGIVTRLIAELGISLSTFDFISLRFK